MGFKSVILICIFVLLSSGCGSYYTRSIPIGPLETSESNILVTDIRQRAIVSGQREEGGRTVTCAEPSPDAMSALSASLSAAFENRPDQSLEFAQSFSESAAFVGNRTQTIQLLRDGMYRLCEAYMAGGMSDYQYQWMMRRYQRNMVGILAIESLTGAIAVPTTTVGGTASATLARSISDLEERLSEVNDEIARLEEEAEGLEDSDKEKKEELKASVNRLKDTKEVLEDAIKNTSSVLASSSAKASLQTEMSNVEKKKSKEERALEIVGKIIDKIYEADDAAGLCLEALLSVNVNQLARVQEFCSGNPSIKQLLFEEEEKAEALERG